MHARRLCLPRTAAAGEPYPSRKAQGWKPDALPEGWKSRWRSNGSYHDKHSERLQRLRRKSNLVSVLK